VTAGYDPASQQLFRPQRNGERKLLRRNEVKADGKTIFQ
jgi:hypothetical protein